MLPTGVRRDMKKLVLVSVVLVQLLFMQGMQPAFAAFSTPDKNSCSADVNDPHISVNAGGIIAKARWKCGDASPVKSIYYVFYLWRCPDSYVVKDYPWLDDHCFIKGYDYDLT
jgi:hypothetical protein